MVYIDNERKVAIGKRIQTWRKQRKLTQEKLAGLIDRSTDTISMIERGINFPSRETLEQMSKVLGIPIKEFLIFDDSEYNDNPEREEVISKINGILYKLNDEELKKALGLIEVLSG